MKRCTYCGKENPDSAGQCGGCGTDLPSTEAVASDVTAPAEPPYKPFMTEDRLAQFLPREDESWTEVARNAPTSSKPFMTAEQVAEFFPRENGFTRPDWEGINALLKLQGGVSTSAEWQEANTDAVMTWATRLAEDFGGGYRATQSPNFICVSELETPDLRRVLRFAEHAEGSIRKFLGEVAWRGHYKHLLILLTEQDDYDHYIAQFYPEGVHAASLGQHINHGYPHIVVHFIDWHEALITLTHELAHGSVNHLDLPLWLDEGVAQTLAKQVGDVPPPASLTDAQAIWSIQSNWTPPLIWGELAERHHEFWNEENIQSFWAGTLFHDPGDPNELSYSLAEVLVNLIAQDYGHWLEFLTRAEWDDAGQTAALDCFGKGLGEIAGTFLGPGEWRPVRQELVRFWKQAGWEK
jgi:hypothetical protein